MTGSTRRSANSEGPTAFGGSKDFHIRVGKVIRIDRFWIKHVSSMDSFLSFGPIQRKPVFEPPPPTLSRHTQQGCPLAPICFCYVRRWSAYKAI